MNINIQKAENGFMVNIYVPSFPGDEVVGTNDHKNFVYATKEEAMAKINELMA